MEHFLPGSFYVDFIVRGVMCNEPFMLPIKANSGTVPQHAYVGEERAKRFGAKPIGSSVTLSAPSPVVLASLHLGVEFR